MLALVDRSDRPTGGIEDLCLFGQGATAPCPDVGMRPLDCAGLARSTTLVAA